MLPEIGSNFWLDPNDNYTFEAELSVAEFGYKGKDTALLSTGRAAENMVLDDVESRNPNINKVAIVPPYTCHTVLEPFYKHGYELYTYRVSLNLETSAIDLRKVIEDKKPGIVLIHRYFGFDTVVGCHDIIDEFSEKGIVFVEDGTQSLFSNYESLNADYYTGSLRKWAGLPDGGFAVSKKTLFRAKPDEYDVELTAVKLSASYEKNSYIQGLQVEKQHFLSLYAEAEQILNSETKYYKISPVSVGVFNKLNIKELINRRRENYSCLFERVRGRKCIRPILGQLTREVVPLYFPIYVEDRIAFQTKLREERIYAPIVWPLPDKAPLICNEAKELYNHLICIPIDQRYGIDDMMRIIDCMEKL
jgi:dTDP-4-amino-4,6-dideoxygalactose transaminase